MMKKRRGTESGVGPVIERNVWVCIMQVSREQLTPRGERGPASLLLPLPLIRLCFSVFDELGEYGDFVPSLFDALSIIGNLLFPVSNLAHQAGSTA